MFSNREKKQNSSNQGLMSDPWQQSGGKFLSPPKVSLTSSPIQRVKEKTGPNKLTYSKLKNETSGLGPTMSKVQSLVKAELKTDFTITAFSKAWNKITKPVKNDQDDEIFQDEKKLADEVLKSMSRSAKCKENFKKRKGFSDKMLSKFNENGTNFNLESNPQTSKIKLNSMNLFGFDKNMSPETKLQRHLSTMILNSYKGVESQSSISNDHKTLYTGTNENSPNSQIQSEISQPSDLIDLAKSTLKKRKIEDFSPEAINNDRNLRHVFKFLGRDTKILNEVENLKIPKKEDKDGKHIELRIVDDKGWDKNKFNMPSGTRLPCMGCYSYLNSKNLKVGEQMGPLWTSSCSIHTQLERYNSNNFSVKDIKNDSTFFTDVFKEFGESFKKGKMGYGIHKDGKKHDEFDADSDDDLDEKEIQEVKKQLDN